MEHMKAFSFGPVVPDGFGFGYNLSPERIRASISCLEPAHSEEDCNAIAKSLRQALADLNRILQRLPIRAL